MWAGYIKQTFYSHKLNVTEFTADRSKELSLYENNLNYTNKENLKVGKNMDTEEIIYAIKKY